MFFELNGCCALGQKLCLMALEQNLMLGSHRLRRPRASWKPSMPKPWVSRKMKYSQRRNSWTRFVSILHLLKLHSPVSTAQWRVSKWQLILRFICLIYVCVCPHGQWENHLAQYIGSWVTYCAHPGTEGKTQSQSESVGNGLRLWEAPGASHTCGLVPKILFQLGRGSKQVKHIITLSWHLCFPNRGINIKWDKYGNHDMPCADQFLVGALPQVRLKDFDISTYNLRVERCSAISMAKAMCCLQPRGSVAL